MSLAKYLNNSEIPLFAVRYLEGKRIFELIQQNITKPKNILSLENISQFLTRFFPSSTSKASEILYELSKQNAQMNEENFATALAKKTGSIQLKTEDSIVLLYEGVKDFFSQKFEHPLDNIDRWDSDQLLTPQVIQKRQINISDFYSKLQAYVDGMEIYTFQNSLDQINYCLSISTITSNYANVQKVYHTFTHPTVLYHISEFIKRLSPYVLGGEDLSSLNDLSTILKYFKCISYFYGVCRFRPLRQRLQNTSCLFFLESYPVLINSLKIKGKDIKKQIMIALTLLSRYSDKFNDWLLADINNNLLPLLQQIAQLGDQGSLFYALECLKCILNSYHKKPQSFKKLQENLKVLEKIHTFSFMILKNSQMIETQKSCLQLVSQVLKECNISVSQIEQLRMINKVFQSNSQTIQTALIPVTLKILEISLLTKNQELTKIIINDPVFILCMKKHLGISNSPLYYEILNITYVLSYQNVDFLFQNGLFQGVVRFLVEGNDQVFTSIGAECLFNVILQGLEKEKVLEQLYGKYDLFGRTIKVLLKKCFQKSQYLGRFLHSAENMSSYNYFDKNLLKTIWKTLYCLAVGVSRRHKKVAFSRVIDQQFQRLDSQIVKSITSILEDLFRFDNQPLVQLFLRQKIKILDNQKIKLENGIQLYKLISIILEQMTYNMQNRPLDFLRLINREKKSYCNNLLKYFRLHELEVQGIPVYITLNLLFQNASIKRQVPHKFQLSSIKNYIRSYIARLNNLKQSQIRDIVIKSTPNRFIQNQVQYRAMVNKSIQNKTIQISLQIVDFVVKNKKDDLSASYVGPFGESLRGTQRSQRFQNTFSTNREPQPRHVARFTTSRQGHNQQNIDPRRSYYSPHNISFSYRQKSPNFGSGGRRT